MNKVFVLYATDEIEAWTAIRAYTKESSALEQLKKIRAHIQKRNELYPEPEYNGNSDEFDKWVANILENDKIHPEPSFTMIDTFEVKPIELVSV